MVGMYAIRMREGGIFYEEVVCADSWEDAEVRAEEMGGEVTCRLGDLPVMPTDDDNQEL